MKKYHCYYLNDFRDDYPAMSKEDPDGDWYRAEDVDAELDTMNLAVGYFHEENDRFITRIAELEKALRKIVETAAPTSHHANYCVVHRQILGEARSLMGT